MFKAARSWDAGSVKENAELRLRKDTERGADAFVATQLFDKMARVQLSP
jgi:hypothetical protein